MSLATRSRAASPATRPASPAVEAALLVLKGTRPTTSTRTQRHTYNGADVGQPASSLAARRTASPASGVSRPRTAPSPPLAPRPRLTSPSPPPAPRGRATPLAAPGRVAASPVSTATRPATAAAAAGAFLRAGASPSRDVRASADGVLAALGPRAAASPVRASTGSPAPALRTPPTAAGWNRPARPGSAIRSPSPGQRPATAGGLAWRDSGGVDAVTPVARTQSPSPARPATHAALRTPSPSAASRRAGASAVPTLSDAARSSVAALAAASAAALMAPRASFGSAARAIAAGERLDGPGRGAGSAMGAPSLRGMGTPTAAEARPQSDFSSLARRSPSSTPSPLLPAASSPEVGRLQAECGRLTRLLATQAAQLDALERDNAALKHQVAQRDADCAQLGALLAAVHRRELHPDQLADFAALPAAAAGSGGQAAKPRSAFDNMPTEDVTWEEPLSSRPAVERPSSVPPLSLGTLHSRKSRLSVGDGEASPDDAELAAPRGRSSVVLSDGDGRGVPRPASRAGPRVLPRATT